nr:borealin-like [Procambarus clarkii]
MPRKKRSRMPSRPKPLVPDDSLIEADMESEQRKEKLRLLLEDFDKEVQKRVEMMEMELQSIQQAVRHLYRTDLMQYSAATRNMLWKDYVKENGEKSSAIRKSIAFVIRNAECALESGAKKRGRPPKTPGNVGNDVVNHPATVTRSVRRCRQKAVLGLSQSDNLLPPPSTSRVQRSKKLVAATPVGQNIPQFSSMPVVTPKFDIRNPFPPGTVMKRAKPNDILMNFNGSPVYVSPSANQKIEIKELREILQDDNVGENIKQEILQFHADVSKLISGKWMDKNQT